MEYYSAIKKERIGINSSEVDEARACYTNWNKLEREKYQILMHIYDAYFYLSDFYFTVYNRF